LVHADLPIVIPQIKSAVDKPTGCLVLDVGGDDQGARVLGSLAEAFKPGEYELLLVFNANRPFTADVVSNKRLLSEIEATSRLKFTGLIANTHLMDDTTPETITTGLKLSREVSEATGLRVVFLSATHDNLKKIDTAKLACPVLGLNRSLLKPWESESGDDTVS